MCVHLFLLFSPVRPFDHDLDTVRVDTYDSVGRWRGRWFIFVLAKKEKTKKKKKKEKTKFRRKNTGKTDQQGHAWDIPKAQLSRILGNLGLMSDNHRGHPHF